MARYEEAGYRMADMPQDTASLNELYQKNIGERGSDRRGGS
jgi:hypothetical protein